MIISSYEGCESHSSEIQEKKDKPLHKLRNGTLKVKYPNGILRCPFCAAKKNEIFKYKDLQQHALELSKGSSNKNAEDKANHLALAKYLEIELAGEAEHPLKVAAPMMTCNNIRNICVIGHAGHGKSTLSNCVKTARGISAFAPLGDEQIPSTLRVEGESEIAIMSTGTYLYCKTPKEYNMTLIDSPGHVDFSYEVTAALRITDGAIVVVDCIEGFCVNTEMAIRQAISEGVKLVLTVNKIDRCFVEHQVDGEEMYLRLKNAIDNTNVIIHTYKNAYKNPLPGDVKVDPCIDNSVAFSCGKGGWAFRLSDFATMYAKELDLDKTELVKLLWGENYYDKMTRKWTKVPTKAPSCKRGFVLFCFEPIKQVIDLCMKGDTIQLQSQLGFTLEKDDLELRDEEFVNCVMQKWLPATCLLEMIFELPSPPMAQKYRFKNLYMGLENDQYASAIRDCDPSGPLMAYVYKMISGNGRGIAFGRIFSGKISNGLKVCIRGPNHGKKEDVVCMENKNVVVKCGNIIALHGLDEFVTKNATLTNYRHPKAYPIRAMKFFVSPVLRVAITCSSFSKLAHALELLVKCDPVVVCTRNEKHKAFITGVGESHLKKCVSFLEANMGGIEIHVSNLVVSYCETVVKEGVMSKAPNMLHLEMRASPLIQDEVLCFDPEKPGTRVSFKGALRADFFKVASQKGALAEENMRGIHFDYKGLDASLEDITSLMQASQLGAEPRLLEPFYLCEVLVTKKKMDGVYHIFNKRRGKVVEECHVQGAPFYKIKCFIPVVTSIGLSSVLTTHGALSSQFVFDHWGLIKEDPLDCHSHAREIVRQIREFKDLNEKIPHGKPITVR